MYTLLLLNETLQPHQTTLAVPTKRQTVENINKIHNK